MFVIEDQIHYEQDDQFASIAEAIAEFRRRAAIAWDEPPNLAPCQSWRTCGREYCVVEYDTEQTPWKLLRSAAVLNVSAKGVEWIEDFESVWQTSG